MEFITLNLQDKNMMDALLPLYQAYEAEISEEEIEDIFPPEEFEENYKYFESYFYGCITYIPVINGEFKGFVSFHVDTEDMRGYAEGYDGWGHMAEIYTIKEVRGSGLGKIMAKMAEEELKKLGVKGIYLTDISGKGGFWESVGYKDSGKIEPNEGGKIYEKHI